MFKKNKIKNGTKHVSRPLIRSRVHKKNILVIFAQLYDTLRGCGKMPENKSGAGRHVEKTTAQAGQGQAPACVNQAGLDQAMAHANQTTARSYDDDAGTETHDDDDLLLHGSGNTDLDNALMLATHALGRAKSMCTKIAKIEGMVGVMHKEALNNEQICRKLVETTRKLKKDRVKAIQSLRTPRAALHRSGISTPPAGSVHCFSSAIRQKPPSPLEDKEMPELLEMLREALRERERLFEAKKKFITQGKRIEPTTQSIMRMIERGGKDDVDSIKCKKVARDKLETVTAHCQVLSGKHKK